jgi:hypothetical protein
MRLLGNKQLQSDLFTNLHTYFKAGEYYMSENLYFCLVVV